MIITTPSGFRTINGVYTRCSETIQHTQLGLYTNHALQRIAQRNISREAIELTRRYGTESIDDGARKVIIDLDACSIAEEDGVNLEMVS